MQHNTYTRHLIPSLEPGRKRRRRVNLPPCSRVFKLNDGTYRIVYSPWKAVRDYSRIPFEDLTAPPTLDLIKTGRADRWHVLTRSVLSKLRQIGHFPQQRRKRVSADGTVDGFVLGKAHVFLPPNAHGKRKKVYADTQITSTYHALWLEIQMLLRCMVPHAQFTSVQVNRCTTACRLHTDKRNIGPSYVVALGSYEVGGELQVLKYRVNIHDRVLEFNGQLPHRALHHSGGDRYSLVYYNAGDCDGCIQSRDPNIDLIRTCNDPERVRLRVYDC